MNAPSFPVTPDPSPAVFLTRGDTIRPEPIDWLWGGWLAAGKFHVLAGAPGTGKTTIALALSAALTTRGHWPDGSPVAQAGNVLGWSGEDDARDTLAPRLIACGADIGRVHFVTGVQDHDGRRPFDPATDMDELEEAARRVGNVRLLVCDPVVSAVTGDSHKNTEVRRCLQPLVDLGAELKCAVLGITHFAKNSRERDPTERVVGSLAFGALARVVMAAAKIQGEDNEHAGRRILCRSKSNIGRDDGGFVYDLDQVELAGYPGVWASRVQWGEALEGSAREILAQADRPDAEGADCGEREDAERFLRDLLSGGPLPAKQVRADADGAGHSWATIRRAQKTLGVEAVREGRPGQRGGGVWAWRLRRSPSVEHLNRLPETRAVIGVQAGDEGGNGLRRSTSKSERLNRKEGGDNLPSWLPADAEVF